MVGQHYSIHLATIVVKCYDHYRMGVNLAKGRDRLGTTPNNEQRYSLFQPEVQIAQPLNVIGGAINTGSRLL